jgi:acyl dehydratase
VQVETIVIPSIPTLQSFVGTTVGPGEWRTISQHEIDLFARATGDDQWIHVDVARAERESPFKATIAHGYLTLSLIPVLLSELLRVDNVGTIINSGLQKMKLSTPVPAGSRVRLAAKFKHVRDMPGGGARVVMTATIELEGATRPACVADVVYVYLP